MSEVRVAGHTWEELYDQCEQFAAVVEHTLAGVIDRAADRTRSALTAAGPDIGGIADDWSQQVDDILGPYIATTYSSGALATAYGAVNQLAVPAGFGVPSVSSQSAQEFVAGSKIQLKNVGPELEQQIRDTVRKGVDQGLSVDELASSIRDVSGFTQSRANTIARTEIVRASNAGSHAQATLLAEPGDLKEWVATEDSRTREDHAHADGQRVTLNSMFSVGGWPMRYPGDGNAPAGETVNCRCTVTYVLDGDAPPATICACDPTAIVAATVPGVNVKSTVVSPDVCVAPTTGPADVHTSTLHSFPDGFIATDEMKQQLYDEFKGQGPISPAYGGAKIYKHLTGMQASWMNEYQKLALIDEAYAKQGGKSSFLDKFDEWVHSAAGKKATGGTVKPPPVSGKPKPAEPVVTAKPEPEPIIETPKPEPSQTSLIPTYANAPAYQKYDIGIPKNDVPPWDLKINMHQQALPSSKLFGASTYVKPDHIIGSTSFMGSDIRAITGQYGELHIQTWEVDHWHDAATFTSVADLNSAMPGVQWYIPAKSTSTTSAQPASVGHVITPGAKPTPAPSTTDPLDISHVTKSQIDTLYDAFKSIKPVTPGWGGAAIYKNLQAVKQDSGIADQLTGLNDAQLLKMLDAKFATVGKSTSGKTYFDETNKWAASPGGKTYIEKQGVTPTTLSPKPVKSPPTGTPDTGIHGDISKVSNVSQSKIFNAFKSKGTYLSSSPDVIWSNLVSISHSIPDADRLTPLQLIRILDAKGAEKLNVVNTNLYEKKLVSWFKTSDGTTALKVFNMTPEEKAALTAKKEAAAKKAADEQLAKFKSLGDIHTTVPKFDANEKNFSTITTYHAQQLQDAQTPWTPAQRSALTYYTGSNYHAMNGALRGKQTATSELMQKIVNVQAGMRPSKQPMLLHRGTGFNAFGVTNADELRKMIGKTVQEPGFTSTSVGGSAAFSTSLIMDIEAPTGTQMAYVDKISRFQGENEMLLAAHTKFHILDVRQSGSKTIVRVRVVP